MSTESARSGLGSSTSETYIVGTPFAAQVATLIALAATCLALVDVLVNGLAQTLVHLGLGLTVFGAVRLCVGLALAPYRPTAFDDPEKHP